MIDPTHVPNTNTSINRRTLFIMCSLIECIVPAARQLVRHALTVGIFRQSTMHASPRISSHAIPRRYAELFPTSGTSPVPNLTASRCDQQKPRERYDNEKDMKIENPRDNTRQQNNREKTCQRQQRQVPPKPIPFPILLIVAHSDGRRGNRARFPSALPAGPVTLPHSLSRHKNRKTF
jgi:hypothetical protein